MSWHDPDRSAEPQTETALRNELRGLLGIPAKAPGNYFETEPSPELKLLADDLRREARRRTHTARQRSTWMLMAAALPLALALGGLGAWGVAEKHKADHLAAALAIQEVQIERLAAAQQAQPQVPGPGAQPLRVPGPAVQTAKGQPAQVMLMGRAAPGRKPKELVISVERSTNPNLTGDSQSVKAH